MKKGATATKSNIFKKDFIKSTLSGEAMNLRMNSENN